MENLDWECPPRNSKARRVAIKRGKLPKDQPPDTKNRIVELTLSAFIVAEVTISFRSRRLERTET